MLRWLVVAALAYIAFKLIANERQKRLKKQEQSNKADISAKAASGEMVKDPVCGTYVSVSSSISVRDGEAVHYFCGYECRDTFLRQLQEQGRILPKTESKE